MNIMRIIVYSIVANATCMHANVFDDVGHFFDHDVKNALVDTGNAIKGAGETVGGGIAQAGEAIAHCAANSKMTRALDLNVRIAALAAAEQVALGVLKASEEVALATLKATRKTVEGSLDVAQGFLDEVVTRASTVALVAPAEAAKGILDVAQTTTVGVLEGGKFILDQTLSQFDINCLHFDTSQENLARGSLGRGVMRGRMLQDFSIEVDFDAKAVGDSLDNLVNVAANYLKSKLIDPIIGASGGSSAFSNQLRIVKESEHMFDEKAMEIAALKTPEGLAQAQQAYEDSLKKLSEFTQAQREFLKKEVADRKLGAQKLISDTLAKTYDQLLDEIRRMKASRQFDSKLRLLEIELLKRTASLRGGDWQPDEPLA